MVYERVYEMAKYVLETSDTVRGTAKHFCVSKSTVHKDVTHTLKKVNKPLYEEVKSVLEKNKMERHLRGGEATRQKYIIKKSNYNR